MKTAGFLFLAAAALVVRPAALPGAGLLPESAMDWRWDGPDGVFSADTLYELIDGAAEVYRAFNVREVRSRRYVRSGGDDIIADVFDMGTPADAFGAYHFDMREGEDAGIGRESELVGSSLAFWKDRYFVSLTPFADNPAIREAVLALGRSIAGAVDGDGPPPALAAMLPPRGLDPTRVHYFHDWPILDLLTDFSEKDIFGLSRRTEGVLARYRHGPSPGRDPVSLILVRYPSSREAETALVELRARLAESRDSTAVRRSGRIVATAFDAPSRDRADALVHAAFNSDGEGGD